MFGISDRLPLSTDYTGCVPLNNELGDNKSVTAKALNNIREVCNWVN